MVTDASTPVIGRDAGAPSETAPSTRRFTRLLIDVEDKSACTVEREIERIVDEFEAACKRGEQPRIADPMPTRVDAQPPSALLDVLIPWM